MEQTPESTQIELSDNSLTRRERRERPDPSATLRYAAPDGDAPDGLGFAPVSFRGWPVLQQLPTKGAEADIYIVQAGERCVLKLYRHKLEPKVEVLNRVTEVSRANRRHFVVFRETGFDERTGRWYELQEYLPLGSLRDVPAQVRQKNGFIMNLVSELAGALHCLHLNEIVHCDVKPANILIRSLEPLEAVLTDFGISSLLASDLSNKMTRLKGTPMYWAPEAFSRVIGRPCDWWGLGMIVLELLAGEHPFEGLTDSQIIHKLTVSNAEIPASLGARWTLLLRGLLAKDDGKRWGHGEIVRWLAGERGIPVYYEEPGIPGVPSDKISFRFEGKDYFTAEDLARAFAADETPWASGANYLRYVRQWLEKNMMFDRAAELGKDVAAVSEERALFRFVHANAGCPFCLMGKRIDAENLRLFLGRVIRREASAAENRIAGMLSSGELLAYYEEYLKISKTRRDPLFYNLLLLMDKKTLPVQWSCFEAVYNPKAWLWPEDADARSPEKILEALTRMGEFPLRRDTFETLERKYVLPKELLSLLRTLSAYASGVRLLEEWQEAGLLLPRDLHSSGYEDLSLEEYARVARVRCLGHTAALTERLSLVLESLQTLPRPAEDGELIDRVVERLEGLREKKITPADISFLSKIFDLLKRRTRIEKGRWARYAVMGLSVGAFFWMVRFFMGSASDTFFFISFIALMIGSVALVTTYADEIRRLFDSGPGERDRQGQNQGGENQDWEREFWSGWRTRYTNEMERTLGETRRRGYRGRNYSMLARNNDPAVTILFFLILGLGGVALNSDRLFSTFSHIFPFLTGALSGCGLTWWWEARARAENERLILEACAAYSD